MNEPEGYDFIFRTISTPSTSTPSTVTGRQNEITSTAQGSVIPTLQFIYPCQRYPVDEGAHVAAV